MREPIAFVADTSDARFFVAIALALHFSEIAIALLGNQLCRKGKCATYYYSGIFYIYE